MVLFNFDKFVRVGMKERTSQKLVSATKRIIIIKPS